MWRQKSWRKKNDHEQGIEIDEWRQKLWKDMLTCWIRINNVTNAVQGKDIEITKNVCAELRLSIETYNQSDLGKYKSNVYALKMLKTFFVIARHYHYTDKDMDNLSFTYLL